MTNKSSIALSKVLNFMNGSPKKQKNKNIIDVLMDPLPNGKEEEIRIERFQFIPL